MGYFQPGKKAIIHQISTGPLSEDGVRKYSHFPPKKGMFLRETYCCDRPVSFLSSL